MFRKMLIVLFVVIFVPQSLFAVYHKIADYPQFSVWYFDLEGDRAYLGTYEGLMILDVSDPENPEYMGFYDSEHYISYVKVYNDYVFAITPGQMLVIDVSDPFNPALETGSAGNFSFAKVYDDILYVGTYDSYFKLFDLSQLPNLPTVTSVPVPNPNAVNDVSISGSTLYAAAGDQFFVFDNTDIENPELINGYYNVTGFYSGLFASGSILYIVGGGVAIYDMSDLNYPIPLGIYDTPGSIVSMDIIDDTGYIRHFSGGLEVVDFSDPLQPVLISYYDTCTSGRSFTIRDNLAYIADYSQGLQIVDLSDPDFPDLVLNQSTSNRVHSLEVHNSYAYIGHFGEEGIQVYDINELSQPQLVGQFPTYYNEEIREIVVDGDRAYAQFLNYGTASTRENIGFMVIFDISQPENPVMLSYYQYLYADINSMDVSGDFAYLEANGAMQIVDVSNPYNPILAAEYGENIRFIDYDNQYAYLCGPSALLQIIDVSDPTNPQASGVCNLIATGYSVTAKGVTAAVYCKTGEHGPYHVALIDVSNPEEPVLMSTIEPYETSRFEGKPIIYDQTLIISDRNWNEIRYYDISDPANPTLIYEQQWNLKTLDMAVVDGNLLTANSVWGFSVLDPGFLSLEERSLPASESQFLVNYPNPFRQSTTIRYALDQLQQVNLKIYNSSGQLVKDMLNRTQGVGIHTISWDGTNDYGQSVATGTYFYHLSLDNEQSTQKMQLVR